MEESRSGSRKKAEGADAGHVQRDEQDKQLSAERAEAAENDYEEDFQGSDDEDNEGDSKKGRVSG